MKTKDKKMEPVGISAIPEVPVTFWKEVKDPASNRIYYWNPESNATTWILPPNAVIASDESERSDKIRDPEDEEETPLGSTSTTQAQPQSQTQSGKESTEVKQGESEAVKETVEVNGYDETNKKEVSITVYIYISLCLYKFLNVHIMYECNSCHIAYREVWLLSPRVWQINKSYQEYNDVVSVYYYA